jgi:ABC-type molybdate transport system ATPase subunit
MLYVSHDAAEVARIADRVLVMNQGRVQPGRPADADTAESLVKALDRERLESLAAAALRAGLG